MKGTYNLDPSSQKPQKRSTQWSRSTIFLVLSCLGLSIFILYLYFTPSDEPPLDCEDISCYESIIEINNFVDPSTPPCDDFHQFACGNFFKNAFKKQITSTFTQEQTELENELKETIVESIFPEDSRPVQLQKTFYQACMDVVRIDAEQDVEILGLIDQLGGWPLSKRSNWQEKKFNWIDVLLKCRKLGLPFQWFLEFGIHWDERNFFKISYPSINTNSGTKISNHIMEEVITNLVGEKTKVQEISKFEKQFAKLLVSQKSEIVITTVGQLQQTIPVMNWVSFLNNITDGNYEFTEDTEIASNIGGYFEKLLQLLAATKKRVQANYIIWKIIQYFSPYMSERVRQHIDRSEFCVEAAKEKFPYVTEIEYIRRYSSEELKHSVEDLVDEIKSEFLKRIEESTWLNTTAGQAYLETFSGTIIEVGGGDEIFDDAFVEENYLNIGNLTFEGEDPSIIRIITERSKFYYDSIFSTINETGIDPEEKAVILMVTQMGPNFHRYLNKLILPLPLLHGFLYDIHRPAFLNFGSLGTIIANGFVNGIQELTEDDVNVTNIAFETSNRCFEDDYAHLTSSETGVIFDNSQVVKEVLPELIARDIAYISYQKWVETNGEEDIPSPLSDYTQNQLFWIKSSLINCHKKLPNTEDVNVVLSKFKNILSVRHSRHFGQVFDCPNESPMNPAEKC